LGPGEGGLGFSSFCQFLNAILDVRQDGPQASIPFAQSIQLKIYAHSARQGKGLGDFVAVELRDLLPGSNFTNTWITAIPPW
jgi:hypothetical protein